MEKDDAQHPVKPGLYSSKVWLTSTIVALLVIFLLLFKALFSILLLTLAGILMAVYFHGFANLLRKIHVPAKVSVAAAVLINAIIIAAFFWFVGSRLNQQVSQLTETLPQTVNIAKEKISSLPLGSKLINYLSSSGTEKKMLSTLKVFFFSSFGILSDVYIVILIGAFFTATPTLYKKGVVSLLPGKVAKEKGEDLLNQLNSVLKKWLKAQIIGFVFIAALSGIGLYILGMPLVFTLALIAGLLNFIPNFGPIIALIPAVLIALTKDGTTALIVIGIYTFIQIIQSAVQQPLVQKKMVNIPPVLTIIGQIALGTLAGFWGVLLATPIVAILMTVVDDLYLHKKEVSN